jgi:hypothetical protein
MANIVAVKTTRNAAIKSGMRIGKRIAWDVVHTKEFTFMNFNNSYSREALSWFGVEVLEDRDLDAFGVKGLSKEMKRYVGV